MALCVMRLLDAIWRKYGKLIIWATVAMWVVTILYTCQGDHWFY